MTASGTDYAAGVIYTYSADLAAGQYAYHFEAEDGSGHTATTDANVLDVMDEGDKGLAQESKSLEWAFLILLLIAIILWVLKWVWWDNRGTEEEEPEEEEEEAYVDTDEEF